MDKRTNASTFTHQTAYDGNTALSLQRGVLQFKWSFGLYFKHSKAPLKPALLNFHPSGYVNEYFGPDKILEQRVKSVEMIS